MVVTRIAVVICALVFVRYAYLDTIYHLRFRKPSKREDLLHLVLGLCELAMIGGALWPHATLLLSGAAATAALGAIDEYVFHVGLPSDENNYHAKGHLALFMLFAAAVAIPHFAGGADAASR